MTTVGDGSAGRVPGYLGRILDSGDEPVGTCFQVTPGVLVTAWHVIDEIGAADAGMRVRAVAGIVSARHNSVDGWLAKL
jgi:hypothetical protein